MNLTVFEKNVKNLVPFTNNHASFEIKLGLYTELERISELYSDCNISLIVRPEIEDLIKDRYPQYTVNPAEISDGHIYGHEEQIQLKIK